MKQSFTARSYYATFECGYAGNDAYNENYLYMGDCTSEALEQLGQYKHTEIIEDDLSATILRQYEFGYTEAFYPHDYIEPSEYAIVFP